MTEPDSARPCLGVAAQANFPAIELEILARWQSDGMFRHSVAARSAGKGQSECVFYGALVARVPDGTTVTKGRFVGPVEVQ